MKSSVERTDLDFKISVSFIIYHNDPKCLDTQVLANSADLDQTAARGLW